MAKKAAKKTAAPKAARKAAKKAQKSEETKPEKPAARKAAKKAVKATARKAAKKAVKKAAPKTAKKAVKPADSIKTAPPASAPKAEVREEQSGSIRPAARKSSVSASSLNGLARRSPVRLPRPSVTMEEVAQRELPEEYGETRVAVLVRDPEWIFVYWEISSADRASFGLHPGGDGSPLLLRLYEDGSRDRVTDVPVNDLTSSWYVRVPVSGASYVVELGLKKSSGEYAALARSHRVNLPRAEMAEVYAEGFEQKLPDVFRQLVQLSGGFDLGSHLGSEEFSLAMQRRLMDESSSFSGMLFSGGLLSSGEMYSGAFAARNVGDESGRDFWLTVGVDVIVYGATEPDADVSLMGRPIKLTPEGTFRVRMAFPDGRIEFPVEATSGDGVETRRVSPIVERETN